MSKILYLVRYSNSFNFSIKNKIDGQIKALEHLGNKVCLITSEQNGLFYIDSDGTKRLLRKQDHRNYEKYWHFGVYWDLFLYAKRIISRETFDVVYVRSSPAFLNAISFFRLAKKKKCRVIVEIPTNSNSNKQSLKNRLFCTYSNCILNGYKKFVDLFVVCGNKADSYLGRPSININNGVDLEALPISHEKDNKSSNRIVFLAVASMSHWHGYDRLIKGLALYRHKERVVINFIGDEGDGSLNDWKKLVDELGLKENVFFLGKKYGTELDSYFDDADLCIGTLSFGRVGIKESSVLKNREYMARGVPFIYSSFDADIQNCPFCFQVEDNEEPIDIDSIMVFLKECKKDSNYKSKMREYARQNLSWEKQLIKIFDN